MSSEYDRLKDEAKRHRRAYIVLAKRHPIRAEQHRTLYEQAEARAEGVKREELDARGEFDVEIRPAPNAKPQTANRAPGAGDNAVAKERILRELVGFSAEEGDGLCSLYLRDPAGMYLPSGPQRISSLKADEGWPILTLDCTKHETDDPGDNVIGDHSMYRFSIPFVVAQEYIRPEEEVADG